MPVPAAITPNLRNAGLEGGHMLVDLQGETLELRGERAGQFILSLADIERMRVGYATGRGATRYETVIWRRGASNPITISPLPVADPAAYAAIVRDLAAGVARRQGRGSVETGYSPAYWAMIFGTLVVVMLVTLGVVLLVVPGEDVPGWSFAYLILFPLLLIALVVREYVKVHRPRAVRDLAELDRHLPKPRRIS